MLLEIAYFYSLTPRQFFNILKGYRRKEEAQYQEDWVRTRMVLYYSILPHTDKKQLTPEDIFQFPWEKQTDQLILKPKTRKQLTAEFKALEKQLKKQPQHGKS